MRKTAFITGITGQDGSYLAELLLNKDYEVHGLVRRVSTINRTRIDHLRPYETGPDQRLYLHYGYLADSVITSLAFFLFNHHIVFSLFIAHQQVHRPNVSWVLWADYFAIFLN